MNASYQVRKIQMAMNVVWTFEFGVECCDRYSHVQVGMRLDSEIVAETLAGNKDLFAEIVRRYESPLKRVAFSRLGRATWADDVVQETFYWAFKCLDSYDSHYSFRTWLWTILLNQCRRRQQKLGRTPTVSPWTDVSSDEDAGVSSGQATECHEPGPSERLLAKERNEQLEVQLSRLSEDDADALRLRFFGGLKFQEIADAMGCSLSGAKLRVRRGLTKMSEQLASTDNDALTSKSTNNSNVGDQS